MIYCRGKVMNGDVPMVRYNTEKQAPEVVFFDAFTDEEIAKLNSEQPRLIPLKTAEDVIVPSVFKSYGEYLRQRGTFQGEAFTEKVNTFFDECNTRLTGFADRLNQKINQGFNGQGPNNGFDPQGGYNGWNPPYGNPGGPNGFGQHQGNFGPNNAGFGTQPFPYGYEPRGFNGFDPQGGYAGWKPPYKDFNQMGGNQMGGNQMGGNQMGTGGLGAHNNPNPNNPKVNLEKPKTEDTAFEGETPNINHDITTGQVNNSVDNSYKFGDPIMFKPLGVSTKVETGLSVVNTENNKVLILANEQLEPYGLILTSNILECDTVETPVKLGLINTLPQDIKIEKGKVIAYLMIQ